RRRDPLLLPDARRRPPLFGAALRRVRLGGAPLPGLSSRCSRLTRRSAEADAMRIVSLLPSATEIVCLLGLEDSLVGVSHECDFPPSVRRLPKVVRCSFDPAALSQREIDEMVRSAMRAGGTACEVDADALISLAPDLVITQELCDVCAVPQASAIAAVQR